MHFVAADTNFVGETEETNSIYPLCDFTTKTTIGINYFTMELNKIKCAAIALSTLTLATSCALDEDFRNLEPSASTSGSDSREIGFNVQTGQSTRANNLFRHSQFEITAFDGDDNFYGGRTDLVTTPDNGSSWTSDRTRYWPTDRPDNWEGLTFYAYIDGNDNSFSRGSRSMTGKFDITGTVPAIRNFEVDSDVSMQRDLMYAVAKNVSKKTNSGKVSLHFRHALSRISFTSENSNPAFSDIEIISVELGGVKGKATYYYPDASTEGGMIVNLRNTNEGRWIFTSDAVDNSYIINDLETSMYLIPQNVDARINPSASEGGYIKLTVRKTPKGASEANSPETVYLPLSVEWQEGHDYVYNISWKASLINFSVTDSEIKD